MEDNCPLCDAKGVTRSDGLDMYEAHCGVCGDYSISGLERLQISTLSREDLGKLRAVVKEHSLKGRPAVIVSEREVDDSGARTIEQLLTEYPVDASDMMNRVMLNLAKLANHPCDTITLGLSDYPILLGRSSDDMIPMIKHLESLEYVESSTATTDVIDVSITPQGRDMIDRLHQGNLESNQVFVAMWFSEEMQRFWKHGFERGIRDAGDYSALRADQQEHNQKICDRIMEEIRRSCFLVADFTGDRGGVYYEAGFAQGLGMPVIWTVRGDWLGKVHFDTRQYNHIVYETPEELREALKKRIRATIAE